MQRIATVCVIAILVLAGCAGSPVSDTSDSPTGENGQTNSEVVTYTNDSDNSTFEMAVDHDSETYDMSLESTLGPNQTDWSRNVTINLLCGVLEQGTYNRSNANNSVDNSSGYTKTTASGDETEVDTIPDDVFEYEPEDVTATTYAQNGSKLDSCTVNGVGDTTFNGD